MPGNSNKWYVFSVCTLTVFMMSFAGSAVNVALPSIEKELNIDTILLGWIATAYILTTTILIIPCGKLADIHGRKKIFTIGTFIYTVATIILTFSNSAFLLIACRAVQGIGAAMYFSTSVAMLMSVFPVNERGRALGMNVAATYMGLSTGPFLGGLLTGYLGWRSVFGITVPIGLVVIILLFWKIKDEWAEAQGESFDTIGAVLIAIMLGSLIYGFSSLPSIKGIVCVAVSIVAFLVFYRWELREKSPLLDMDLFRKNKGFFLFNITALINYSATFAIAFLMSLYLQYNHGFSPQTAGLIMIAQPVVQTTFSPLAGRLSDRIKPYILSTAGMAIMVVGLILLIFLREDTGLAFIVTSLAFLGFGYALFSSPNTNAVMSSVASKFYGVASAVLASMRTTGMMMSMGIVMMIFSIIIGKVQITQEQHIALLQSTKTAFIVFTVLCFGGMLASIAGGRASRDINND
jgi:EmrB/QacA subfamily drug resistance transporter